MNLLENNVGIITGITNKDSIAHAIARVAIQNGARIILTYPNDNIKERLVSLFSDIKEISYFKYDASINDSIIELIQDLKSAYKSIDFLIHSIAYCNKDELKSNLIEVNRVNFLDCLNISCYSLIELSNHISKVMTSGGSIITLTHYGSSKVVPNYNLMGVAKAALESSVKYIANDLGHMNIRVNGISAGPIRTVSSRVIKDFHIMLDRHQKISPLRKNITQQDVAFSALYLLSRLSGAVTGEIHYVDCGYNTMSP